MMPAGLIAPARPVIPLKTIISSLSLPTPDLVLDAGDPASFSIPTAETWVDVQNGNNFFVGTSGSVDADQPAFEGTVGDFTGAFGFTDSITSVFREASDLSFAENWHKNNAAFTVVGLIYLPYWGSGPAKGVYIFTSCDGSTSSRGIICALTNTVSTKTLALNVAKGSSPLSLAVSADVTSIANTNSWNFVAIALDEATGTNGVTFHCNGQNVQATSTYTSPSASGTTSPYDIGGPYNATVGAKMKMFAGWSSRLTTAQLENLYTRVRQDRQFDLP